MNKHLIYFSIPGLRVSDASDATLAPTLHRWASQGTIAEFHPTFPCVTSPVQATTWTGRPPSEHGVIANGFFHKDRSEVEFWVARNGIIEGQQIWDVLKQRGLTSAVWHAQNIKDAAADFIVTPAPIHEPDGSTKLWCYSKPDGLYQQLLDDLGHFPLQHYWGPLSNIESSKWILNAAKWLIKRNEINFHYIYLPHLDYAAQKFGPDSDQARNSVTELNALLADFESFVADSSIADSVQFIAASEYAMSDVSGAVQPNVALRNAGLLETHQTEDGNAIDFKSSRAFAMVDHQFAHVFVRESQDVERVAEILQGLDGIAALFKQDQRKKIEMENEHCGDIILISQPDRWFAYYWWTDHSEAPPFARTVDIHRKPGYDPVELFLDMKTKSIPLDPSLPRGSHGVPISMGGKPGAIVASSPEIPLSADAACRDTHIKDLILNCLNK